MNKLTLGVLVGVTVLGLVLQTGTPVMAAAKKAPVKKVATKKVVVKKVLGKNKKGQPIYTYSYNVVDATVSCSMPDGKTIKVLKSVCDEVTAFWSKHKSSGGSSNNGGGGSSSNNNGGGSNSNPGPLATISGFDYMGCGSSSCVSVKTFRVRGTKFNADSKFEVIDASNNHIGVNTVFYHNPDATLVGQTATELIMDFHNLPCGATYGVRVVDAVRITASSDLKITVGC